MPRHLAILALPGVQLLDVAGPLDVFAQANRESGRNAYTLRVIACAPGPISSSSGARLVADGHVGQPPERYDTLLVAGAPNAQDYQPDAATRTWLLAVVARARRFGSVCSGAFVLARCGLLDGHRITTHWACAEALAQAYPAVRVEADAIHVRDGRLRTSAGVTAGLDLALSLVEEDLGRDVARRVAAQLVMYFKRPGGQAPFSRSGASEPAGRAALQEVQRWIVAEPAAEHSVRSLAARTGLSPRHFARLFTAELGMAPAAWVEQARVEAARALLEEAGEAPKQVAAKVGFSSVDTLRRAFVRQLGISPAEYRKRFHA
ncbi:MAG: HTH-type transcriptional regulator CdhR [Stenotrophomonas maltophilia]|nr:MAG: HTH-type transcriptional regulator CdhR [Stenotrophomonas maltophilia]